jgi:hypothetical protein
MYTRGGISPLKAGARVRSPDAHRDDGKRFVARADEKLTAFLELELAIHGGQRLVVEQPMLL